MGELTRDPKQNFGALIARVRFALDSLLEEAGFEPSVPRLRWDLVGHVLAQEPWEVLSFPAVAEAGEVHRIGRSGDRDAFAAIKAVSNVVDVANYFVSALFRPRSSCQGSTRQPTTSF